MIAAAGISKLIMSSKAKRIRMYEAKVNKNGNTSIDELAAYVGAEIAKKAKKAKIEKVVFDRGARLYAGRMKALADAARKEGLEF